MAPAGDLVLETGETLTFTILGKGATETFDWEITAADPAGVASFVGANDNVDEVTVQGDKEGTFEVQATSKADGLVYTSGTVEVVSLTSEITHIYVSGLNLVPFSLTGTGVLTAANLRDAIESANGGVAVSQIFTWDSGNQRFGSAYVVIAGTGYFDFDLVEGAAYFVQTDGPGSLTLSGQDYVSFQLNQGLNLMSVPPGHAATISSAADFEGDIATKTGLDVSQIFGWDEANQRYGSAYVVIGGTGYFDFNLSVEEDGYFVQTSGSGTYTP